jgi:predicted extracellular nuclease
MIGTNELGFANSRKPIIGLFEYKGQDIVVIGVHLVSKGLNSPLYGSEQPISQPELEKRIAEATFVSNWVELIKRISPGAIIVVAGDMNDGEDSQVVRTILGKTLVDTAETIDEGERYSLIHDGLATLFDHILVSNNAVDYSLRILHLNSNFDESTQVSDHDPLLLTLRFP